MKKFLSFALALQLYAAFPDYYYKIKNTQKQKQAFTEILLPLIQTENEKIKTLRNKIIEIFNDPYYMLYPQKVAFLAKVAKKYKIKDINNKKEFLEKINIIPPSLALAQGAIESGWGKSRFVRLGNNIFGHWIYSNKGIAPKSTYDDINITYSLRIFPSLEDSVAAYMLNLNRNRAYKKFRELREKFYENNKTFTGIDAADTMINYSQKKETYINMLKQMIKSNKWQNFDK